MESDPKTLPVAGATVELALARPDGAPWPLTLTVGMERFIGVYPRVEGICPAGQLLRYTKP